MVGSHSAVRRDLGCTQALSEAEHGPVECGCCSVADLRRLGCDVHPRCACHDWRGLGMNIAVLGTAPDVYAIGSRLVLVGHRVHANREKNVETFVLAMIEDGVEAVLTLPGSSAEQVEVATRFSDSTGRPVWRDFAECSMILPLRAPLVRARRSLQRQIDRGR